MNLIFSFFEIIHLAGGNPANSIVPHFTGGGIALGGSVQIESSPKTQSPSQTVRDRWANRFEPTQPKVDATMNVDVKLPVPFTTTNSWQTIDEDLAVREVFHEVINLSDDEDDINFDSSPTAPPSSAIEKQSPEDRQRSIREELIDNDDDVIELIDDEFDDDLHNQSLELLTDATVINDLFGNDTLLDDFNNLNAVIMKDPENVGNSNKEIIECPICQEKMARELLNEHFEGCGGIVIEVKFNKFGKSKTPSTLPFYKKKPPATQVKPRTKVLTSQEVACLLDAGYTTNDIRRLELEKTEEVEYNRRILNEMANEERERSREFIDVNAEASTSTERNDHPIEILEDQHPCPVCSTMISAIDINSHLDTCLLNCDD